MQFVITILSSGIVAAVVTAFLNISIQTRTLRMNRLEELSDCLYKMSSLNDRWYWKMRWRIIAARSGDAKNSEQSSKETADLETEFEDNKARSLTLSAISNVDVEPLRKFLAICTARQKFAFADDDKRNEESEKEELDIALERDAIVEKIVEIIKIEVKKLQNPWHLFRLL